MSDNSGLNVIFGTGPLGKAVMRELVRQGQRVRMVNRSGQADEIGEGVEVVKGDVTDPQNARQVSQGASVIYFCAQPAYTKWPELFPAYQAGVIEAAAATGAKLVSGENTYMYGHVEGVQTEDLPYKATTRKGRVRGQMAHDLMAAHQAGRVRATIGRASNFYGPGVLDSTTGDRLFYPALSGKKASTVGKLDVLHTYTYIDDFGRALVTLGQHEESLGQVWHVPSAPTVTSGEFFKMVYEEAGQTPKFGTIPNLMVKMLGLFIPNLREVEEMLYEFEQPFVVNHSKFAQAFGENTTPHREALRETITWFRQHPQVKH